jgi:gliding motility-associated-like protein
MSGKRLWWVVLASLLWAQALPQYELILDQKYVRASDSAPDSVDVYVIVRVFRRGNRPDTLISSNFPFFYNMALDFSGARVIHERKFSDKSRPNYYNAITYPFTPARVNVTVRRKAGYTGEGDVLVFDRINQRDTVLALRVPVRVCGPGQRSILVWDSASAAILNSQLQSIKPRIGQRWRNDTLELCPPLPTYAWSSAIFPACVGDLVSFSYINSFPPDAADPDSFVVFTQRVSDGVVESYPGLGGGTIFGGSFSLAFSRADNYRVWIRFIEKKCGCYQDGPIQGIRVHPLPVVGQIIGPDTVYVGGSMAGGYRYSVSVGAGFFRWYGREGSGGSAAPAFSPSNATSTSVTFEGPSSGCRPDTLWAVYQTANGCQDSSRKVVAVCPCGAAGTVSASSSRVCQGEVAYLYLSEYVGDSVRWYIDTTGSWALVTAGSFPNSLTYETPPLPRTARFQARVYQGRCYVESDIILISVDTFRVQSITLSPRTGTGTCVGDTVRFDTTVSRRPGNLDIDSLVLIVRTPAGDTVYYPDRLWFVPTLAGTYQVWVMVYGGRCAGVMSDDQNWTIGSRPPVYAIQGPDTVYVPPSGASYSYTLPGSFTSLSWSYRPGGGSASTLSGNPTVNVSFTAPPSTGRVDTLIATYEVVRASCPQVSTPKLIAVMPCRSVPSARALTSVVCAGQRGAVEIPLPFPVDSLRWQYWDGSNWQNVPDNMGTGATATLYITPPTQPPGVILRARVHAGPCEVYSDADTIRVSGEFLDRNLYSVQTPICAGDTARLNAGGDGVWLTPNGYGTFTDALDPQASYVSAPNDPNPVRVCWVIRSQDLTRCRETAKDTLCLDITILPAQASGSFNLTPSPKVVCPGEPVSLQGTIIQGVRAEWRSSGDGTFSPSALGTTTTYLPGPGDAGSKVYLTFVVYGSCGRAEYTDSILVQSGATPQILAPNRVCENVALTFLAPNAAAFDSLRWWQGNVQEVQNGTASLLSKDSVYQVPPAGPGVYTFTLQTFSGVCTGYNESTIEVLPAPQVSFEANPRVTTLNNPEITFTNTSQGATSFIWNFGDPNQPSVDSSGAATVTFTYIRPGRYSVVLFGQNDLGCADVYVCTDCIVILPRKVFLPNAFSPNGDGKNDVFRVLPAEEGTPFTRLEVYDRWGQLVFAGDNLPHWDGRGLDGKPLDAGTYTYKAFILMPDEGLLAHTGVVHIVR